MDSKQQPKQAQNSLSDMQARERAPLDVHHGVGVLAGVGFAATAGAGSNGHPVLPAGHVAAHRYVQGGVGIEEAEGLEEEAQMLSRHDWPVLNAGDVGHPKGVPDHTVSLHQVPVLHQMGRSLSHVQHQS